MSIKHTSTNNYRSGAASSCMPYLYGAAYRVMDHTVSFSEIYMSEIYMDVYIRPSPPSPQPPPARRGDTAPAAGMAAQPLCMCPSSSHRAHLRAFRRDSDATTVISCSRRADSLAHALSPAAGRGATQDIGRAAAAAEKVPWSRPRRGRQPHVGGGILDTPEPVTM